MHKFSLLFLLPLCCNAMDNGKEEVDFQEITVSSPSQYVKNQGVSVIPSDPNQQGENILRNVRSTFGWLKAQETNKPIAARKRASFRSNTISVFPPLVKNEKLEIKIAKKTASNEELQDRIGKSKSLINAYNLKSMVSLISQYVSAGDKFLESSNHLSYNGTIEVVEALTFLHKKLSVRDTEPSPAIAHWMETLPNKLTCLQKAIEEKRIDKNKKFLIENDNILSKIPVYHAWISLVRKSGEFDEMLAEDANHLVRKHLLASLVKQTHQNVSLDSIHAALVHDAAGEHPLSDIALVYKAQTKFAGGNEWEKFLKKLSKPKKMKEECITLWSQLKQAAIPFENSLSRLTEVLEEGNCLENDKEEIKTNIALNLAYLNRIAKLQSALLLTGVLDETDRTQIYDKAERKSALALANTLSRADKFFDNGKPLNDCATEKLLQEFEKELLPSSDSAKK